MAETLGVVASAIQVADLGVALSSSLYSYISTVASAGQRLRDVAAKVELTTAVVREVAGVFDAPAVAALRKDAAVAAARATLAACAAAFAEIDDAVARSRRNRLLFPFRQARIAALAAGLESLKSDLALLLHVLLHAQSLAADGHAREEAARMVKERDEALAKLKEQQELADAEDAAPPYDGGGGPFIGFHQWPGQVGGGAPAGVPGSVTTLELQSCVDGLRALIGHIERIQECIPVAKQPEERALSELYTSYGRVKGTLADVIPKCFPPEFLNSRRSPQAAGRAGFSVDAPSERTMAVIHSSSYKRGEVFGCGAEQEEASPSPDEGYYVNPLGSSDSVPMMHHAPAGCRGSDGSASKTSVELGPRRFKYQFEAGFEDVELENELYLDAAVCAAAGIADDVTEIGVPKGEQGVDSVDALLKEWTNVYD